MNEKINHLAYLLAGIFQEIVQAHINQYRRLYRDGAWAEHPDLPYMAVGIKQLEINDPLETVQYYYAVSFRSKDVKIPIDIVDFIVTKDLFTIRFSGLELPLADDTGQLLMDSDQFFRTMVIPIEGNQELISSINASKGGPRETHRTGK